MRRFVYTQCKKVVDEDFASVEPCLTFFDTTAVEQRQQSLEKEQVKTRADVARLEAEIAQLRAASIRSHEIKEILDDAAPPPASG
jgi:hypothetical protein